MVLLSFFVAIALVIGNNRFALNRNGKAPDPQHPLGSPRPAAEKLQNSPGPPSHFWQAGKLAPGRFCHQRRQRSHQQGRASQAAQEPQNTPGNPCWTFEMARILGQAHPLRVRLPYQLGPLLCECFQAGVHIMTKGGGNLSPIRPVSRRTASA